MQVIIVALSILPNIGFHQFAVDIAESYQRSKTYGYFLYRVTVQSLYKLRFSVLLQTSFLSIVFNIRDICFVSRKERDRELS